MIAPPKKFMGVTVSPRIHDFGLFYLLALVLLCRFIVAMSRVDMFWPDEHFQTLEPAFGAVHGFWFKAWEWNEGFRSWIPPLVFMPLMALLNLFDVTGGMIPVIAARMECAVISLLIPWGMNRLARQAGWSATARYAMIAATLAHGAMNLWAVAPLTDSLSTAILWGSYPLAWEQLQRRRGYAAGLLVSLAFLLRPHVGIFALLFGLCVVATREYRKLAPMVLLGGLTVGAVYGIADWIAWGVPFQSLILQLTKGVKLSEFYGVEPWHSYFHRIPADLGYYPIAISAVFLAMALPRWRQIFARESGIPWMMLGALVFFAVHCILRHKETRFVEPVYPLFFLFFGAGVQALVLRFRRRGPVDAVLEWKWVFAGGLAAFLLGTVTALARPIYLSAVDLTPLFGRIYEDEKKGLYLAEGCVLLVNYNWSWSRGALGIGRPYAGEDRRLEEVTGDDFRRCGWVIVQDDHIPEIEAKASEAGRALSVIEKLPNGFVLLR